MCRPSKKLYRQVFARVAGSPSAEQSHAKGNARSLYPGIHMCTGAARVELCDNLGEGGTTPSIGAIAGAVKVGDYPRYFHARAGLKPPCL